MLQKAFRLVPFRAGNVTVAVIVGIIQMFLFINADAIYGPAAAAVKDILILYLVFLTVTVVTVSKGFPSVGKLGGNAFRNFLIAFAFTAIVMLAVPAGLLGTLAAIEISVVGIGYGLLHGFVKSYIEEIIFRYVLPIQAGLGDLLSGALFGVFHVGISLYYVSAGLLAMSALPYAILALIGLGFIWTFVRNQGGLMASVGSHYAYNLAVLGGLFAIFGGVV